MNRLFFFFLFLLYNTVSAQTTIAIQNENAIADFMQKLHLLEDNTIDKLNITHIGDSHIQADFFTGRIRYLFQQRFGNAGYGLSFPYKLAATNGTNKVKFTSNVSFQATRNIFAKTQRQVGITGYSFQSKNKNVAIRIQVNDTFKFKTIKIILPAKNKDVYFANYNGLKDFDKLIPKTIKKYHKVKSGESLYAIARKYAVSIDQIKKDNRIKGTLIHPNQRLIISIKIIEKQKVSPSNFERLPTKNTIETIAYLGQQLRKEIYVFSPNSSLNFAINGFILENNEHGILYHNIGVNGARAAHFNNFPLFFRQLSTLDSDLVILSFGTNESFDHMSPKRFIQDFLKLIENIRVLQPNVQILVTTPPPSLFKHRYKNTFVPKYILELFKNMHTYNYAVWDLYQAMGGYERINSNYKNKTIRKGRIHYTKKGYNLQADMFFKAIINSYNNQ